MNERLMVIFFLSGILAIYIHCAAGPNERAQQTELVDNGGAVGNAGIVNTLAKICNDIKGDCTIQLPLYIVGGSGEADLDEPPREPLLQLNTDALAARFPLGSTLEYSISSGNPEYTLERVGKNKKNKKYPLVGYRINENGELYVRDAWLLGRDEELYSLTDEQAHFFTHGRHWHSQQNVRACGADDCPDGQEFTINRYYFDYTFARTQSDTLVIQIQDSGGKKSIEQTVIVNPHPRALALKSECTQSDLIDRWSCRHSREIIPSVDLETTESHRNSLPDGLARPKGSYDLVMNLEFDSLAETKRYFRSEHFAPGRIEVTDGKLRFNHRKIVMSKDGDSVCALESSLMTSYGLFEPGIGYLEFKFTKYPDLRSNGGNIILWSRYGTAHGSFPFDAPSRLYSEKTTISRNALAKIGFTEIDFLERWANTQRSVWFVVHTYPIKSHLNGIPAFPARKGRLAQGGWLFSASESRPSLDDPGNLSGIGGIELVPGEGLQVFRKKTSASFEPVFSGERGPEHQLTDFMEGAAMAIIMHGVYNGGPGYYDCSMLTGLDLQIELEYMRFYKPRNGY